MRIKEIEARLAAIKKEIEERGDAMKAEEMCIRDSLRRYAGRNRDPRD